jgi:hypothetical protein
MDIAAINKRAILNIGFFSFIEVLVQEKRYSTPVSASMGME